MTRLLKRALRRHSSFCERGEILKWRMTLRLSTLRAQSQRVIYHINIEISKVYKYNMLSCVSMPLS